MLSILNPCYFFISRLALDILKWLRFQAPAEGRLVLPNPPGGWCCPKWPAANAGGGLALAVIAKSPTISVFRGLYKIMVNPFFLNYAVADSISMDGRSPFADKGPRASLFEQSMPPARETAAWRQLSTGRLGQKLTSGSSCNRSGARCDGKVSDFPHHLHPLRAGDSGDYFIVLESVARWWLVISAKRE